MKKIMFNDKYGLTQAVLEGRKTQTRRIVPHRILDMVPAYQEEYWNCALESISVEDAIYNLTHGERRAKAPYYVGEEVAVAQRYSDIRLPVNYKRVGDKAVINKIVAISPEGWHNKMFVRADLMPHRIKITNVRVERLQDISDEDCMKEGVVYAHARGDRDREDYYVPSVGNYYQKPQQAYASLIDHISGKGTWESNPWVFVYEFELVR